MSSDIHNALSALKMFEQQYRGLLELAPVLKDVASLDRFRRDLETQKVKAEGELNGVQAQTVARKKELEACNVAVSVAKKQAGEIAAAAEDITLRATEDARRMIDVAEEDAARLLDEAAVAAIDIETKARAVLKDVQEQVDAAERQHKAKLAACADADKRLAAVNSEVDRLRGLFSK